jgi:hypothetical protein
MNPRLSDKQLETIIPLIDNITNNNHININKNVSRNPLHAEYVLLQITLSKGSIQLRSFHHATKKFRTDKFRISPEQILFLKFKTI